MTINIRFSLNTAAIALVLISSHATYAMEKKRGQKRRTVALEGNNSEAPSSLDALAQAAQQAEQEQAHALWAAQQKQAAIAYQAAYLAACQEAVQQEIVRQAAWSLYQHQTLLQQQAYLREQQMLLPMQAAVGIPQAEQGQPDQAIGVDPQEYYNDNDESDETSRGAMGKRPKYDRTKMAEHREMKIAAAERYRASQGLPAMTEAEKINLHRRQPGLCPEGCTYVFQDLNSIVSHVETVHSASRPYPCTAICEDGLPCAYAAKKRNALNKHVALGSHSSSKKGDMSWTKYRPYIKAWQPAADREREEEPEGKEVDHIN